jgi:hypothetical protein
MIIRKPSRIDLKRENDYDDYEEYKKKLRNKRIQQRHPFQREDNASLNFFTPNQFRHRDLISNGSGQISQSSKLTLTQTINL